jgi:DNA polymerase-3 subunit alpha (Gram-positive type)
MFPKAHAAAYTISSLRIAWFKINHPEAYYCAYFTVRADEFDSQLMCLPAAQIRQSREKLRHELRDGGDREQRIYYILELVEEMQLRGIDFVPIDLHRSDATRFITVAPGRILPPLNAIPSISLAVAGQIVKARSERPFKTRDDLARRAGVSQAVMDNLAAGGCLADLPESSQISLFELLA